MKTLILAILTLVSISASATNKTTVRLKPGAALDFYASDLEYGSILTVKCAGQDQPEGLIDCKIITSKNDYGDPIYKIVNVDDTSKVVASNRYYSNVLEELKVLKKSGTCK